MYKIYINEVPVILKATTNLTIGEVMQDTVHLVKYQSKNTQQIKHVVQLIESGSHEGLVIIHCDNPKGLKGDFNKHFTLVEAAGGLIENEEGEFLFIHRRGFWDMPKGKIEKNETKREAAIREVMEETGIKNVEIINKITVTYHIFTSKSGNRILKKSHWYHMKTIKQKLKPQKEEDIKQALWLTITDLKNKKPIYGNILQTIEAFESHKLISETL